MDDAVYLGDGVYAKFNGFHIEIYTHNGIDVQATIFLEVSVLENLIGFAKHKGFIKK